MADPLRHHKHYQDSASGTASVMERVAEHVASGLGTVTFVITSTLIILIWITINVTGAAKFDAYPFILLNLAFSAQAFYTGALVIIAQKAQTRTDKANELAAAKHREELDAANTALLQANTDLTRQVHDLAVQIHTALQPQNPERDGGDTIGETTSGSW